MGKRHKELESRIQIRPCEYSDAARAVSSMHRRRPNLPIEAQVPWCLEAFDDFTGETLGFAMVGYPACRHHNGRIEARRLVTWGWGAASALYRYAARLAMRETGRFLLTFTDEDEPGHSIRAAGGVPTVRRTGDYWGNRPNRKPGDGKKRRIRWEIPPSN